MFQIADFGRAKLVPSAFEHADEEEVRLVASPTADTETAAGGGGGGGEGWGGGSHKGDYTCQVVMLQFRAPELLVGASAYGPGVDVWAAAGVIAEMILKPAPGQVSFQRKNPDFLIRNLDFLFTSVEFIIQCSRRLNFSQVTQTRPNVRFIYK